MRSDDEVIAPRPSSTRTSGHTSKQQSAMASPVQRVSAKQLVGDSEDDNDDDGVVLGSDDRCGTCPDSPAPMLIVLLLGCAARHGDQRVCP